MIEKGQNQDVRVLFFLLTKFAPSLSQRVVLFFLPRLEIQQAQLYLYCNLARNSCPEKQWFHLEYKNHLNHVSHKSIAILLRELRVGHCVKSLSQMRRQCHFTDSCFLGMKELPEYFISLRTLESSRTTCLTCFLIGVRCKTTHSLRSSHLGKGLIPCRWSLHPTASSISLRQRFSLAS